jgi:predicted DNA-binding protein
MSDKCCIMSDMSSDRITIRVPQALGQRLRSRSRLKGQTESELVREALESYLGQSGGERPAYELAEEAGLIGCVRRAPKDLSTNSLYFEGFGEDKPAKTSARKSSRKPPRKSL